MILFLNTHLFLFPKIGRSEDYFCFATFVWQFGIVQRSRPEVQAEVPQQNSDTIELLFSKLSVHF